MAEPYYEMMVSLADTYHTLPMFPVFEVAHYILMISAVRQDLREGTRHLAKTNPLVCWFCSMLSSFAGGILANFLLGQPILAPFANHFNVGIATVIWYLIFYCPGDVFFVVVSSVPAQVLFVPLKEVLRMRKIAAGVAQAAAIYPGSFLVQLIIGTVKGTGSMQMRNIERLLRGSTGPSSNQLASPSFTMKGCIIISSLVTLQHLAILPLPLPLLLMLSAVAMTLLKLLQLAGAGADPFLPVEGALRPLLFGRPPREPTAAATTSKRGRDSDSKNKRD